MEQDVTSQRRGSSKQCRDPHHIWSNRHPLCVISSTDVKYPTSVAAKQKTHFLETHFWDPPKERLRKKKRLPLKPWSTLFFNPHVLQWLPHLQLGHKHEPITIGWSSRRKACELSTEIIWTHFFSWATALKCGLPGGREGKPLVEIPRTSGNFPKTMRRNDVSPEKWDVSNVFLRKLPSLQVIFPKTHAFGQRIWAF